MRWHTSAVINPSVRTDQARMPGHGSPTRWVKRPIAWLGDKRRRPLRKGLTRGLLKKAYY